MNWHKLNKGEFIKVRAIQPFLWQGENNEKFIIRKGEIISVDKKAFKQLVKQRKMCEKYIEGEGESE